MMEVKIFRVEGAIKKPGFIMPFSKDLRALKGEDAIEKIYADLGSQHKAKRFNVKIASIKEVSLHHRVRAGRRPSPGARISFIRWRYSGASPERFPGGIALHAHLFRDREHDLE